MKKIISLIITICLLFSTVSTMVYAKENISISTGYINTINAKTGESTSYQGLRKDKVIYMLPDDIATIGEYGCESLSVEKEKAEGILNNNSYLSQLYSKLNLDKLFKNNKFEYLVFSRKETTTDYITQIYYYDGYAQTMNKSFKIDTVNYGGKIYLNLEKMLYLMHTQWYVEESSLYCYPLDSNIFDFIGENFSYMYDHSVQHNSLLYEGENEWGHSTRIVLSHILNDVDMRIFIPFYGSDMIQQEWYEEAILQLATTDDSFIDEAGSEQINEYLKDSPFHIIKTGLSVSDTTLETIKELPSKIADTKLNKFSKWNDFSTISTAQLEASQEKLGDFGDIVSVANILVDFNEINTRSKEWGNDFVNGLDILYTINEDVYGDYGKDISKVADDLLDEYENPTEEAAEAAMLDTYGLVLDKLLDKTVLGHIESIIALSNVIIKSNPNYASQIENADLMNTVHALINVENVYLNEFVDAYHDYLHYLGVEEGTSSLRLWELMFTSINDNPQKEVETHAISDIRNALEMFLKTSLRNKTYVYHFNYYNNGGSFWTPTSEAKELKEDIYITYALLSELISTRDYDNLIYLDETFKSVYSNKYGLIREKIVSTILTKEPIKTNNKDDSETTKTETPNNNENSAVAFAGGKGTQKEPYQVSTPKQLNSVRNNLSAYYIQINDIDMSGWDWEPIGTVLPEYDAPENIGALTDSSFDNKYFTGKYNGNNYKISNLTIKKDPFNPDFVAYGLFSGISGGIVENVELENIDYQIIKTTDEQEDSSMRMAHYSICVGGIGGRLDSTAVVENCTVSGNISVANHYYVHAGGIVGYGSVQKCANRTNILVTDDSHAFHQYIACGGITGGPFSKISECINYGNIEASGNVIVYCGGITGFRGDIDKCVNYGTISGEAKTSGTSISPVMK